MNLIVIYFNINIFFNIISRHSRHQSHQQRPNQRSDRRHDETSQSSHPRSARPQRASDRLLLPADQLSGQHHKVRLHTSRHYITSYLIFFYFNFTHPPSLCLLQVPGQL